MNLNNVIFYGTFDFLELGVSHCLDIQWMLQAAQGIFFSILRWWYNAILQIATRLFWESFESTYYYKASNYLFGLNDYALPKNKEKMKNHELNNVVLC